MGAARPGVDDDEDDYMKMIIQEPIRKETSIQRAARLKRESRARGIQKSKAQLEEEAVEAREKALATSLLEDPRSQKSKGLAMMAKMGFTGGGLGKEAGITEPISVSQKDGRGGIGLEALRKRQREESSSGPRSAKTAKLEDFDPASYRERMSKERQDDRLEKQVVAAQRLAERLDEPQAVEDKRKARRLLKSYPVLYRGSIIQRLQRERTQKQAAELARLPIFDAGGEEDADDRIALGTQTTEYEEADDLDEDDEELDEFNASPVEGRLSTVLEYLREKHNYCFWCKMQYPEKEMDGCPGLTEDDHD
ncbi:G-patch domain-containing protein [Drechmeria coniospora]|uniref:G-patch domain-containing protein n=1 Tax=Drechmeria coniospora TaxID=98403 RepID=A0A151GMA0_DRECN|nr:G-patch domain-containing protein [Drechmeria coniospora]KYK58226.1 G-patch domain-containing protein [Drechmeria coniospora]